MKLKVKVNYQKKLDDIIEEILKENKVPSVLLHSCCAPCSTYVIEYLSNYFKITVFYYNPNIYPREEYMKRVEEEKEFISQFKTKYKVDFIEGDYDTEKYYKCVKGLENDREGGERCFKCYELRLMETALVAKEKKYEYFTTTLSVSPYKNAQKLNELGEKIGEKYNIKYLYSDFKKKNGYKRSIELSNIYNLYRQDYCGCIFSQNERNEEKMST
ncbi:epoxyqueuosine reductase QueH [Clostridium felsineum]|uniref:epoxyqueuosine reductase QueH n=1 Tax=Clostridium felsineum TaxID=36839 RepID=UPI00098BFEF5|nr:epoxyqueuosine reductase QueH [Clostridium felsineum]MCR3760636.1 epoxyqueuosine reductase QueH [Clostridium felsineum]